MIGSNCMNIYTLSFLTHAVPYFHAVQIKIKLTNFFSRVDFITIVCCYKFNETI